MSGLLVDAGPMRLELSAESPLIRHASEEQLEELRSWLAANELNADNVRSLWVDTETDEGRVQVYLTDEEGRVRYDQQTNSVHTVERKLQLKQIGRFVSWLMKTAAPSSGQ